MTAPKLIESQISDLKAMIADGLPREQIAEAFGVSTSTVTYHAIRSGHAKRGSGFIPPFVSDDDVLAILRADQPWSGDALCAQTDPESFFPEKGGSTREAKQVCSGCLVQAECLDYALEHDERHGIWGGLSERERRRIKKALTTTHPLTTQESA